MNKITIIDILEQIFKKSRRQSKQLVRQGAVKIQQDGILVTIEDIHEDYTEKLKTPTVIKVGKRDFKKVII